MWILHAHDGPEEHHFYFNMGYTSSPHNIIYAQEFYNFLNLRRKALTHTTTFRKSNLKRVYRYFCDPFLYGYPGMDDK